MLEVPLDVLDDHDGIVNDQTGRQGQPEEGQGVDGEVEELDEGEGADQRDRDGEGRYQGAGEALQEDEDHQHDEQDREEQRDHHFPHGLPDHRGGVEGDLVADALRERFRQLVHLGEDRLVDLQRVRRRELRDAEADGLATVVAQVARVVLGPDLDARHVLQQDQRAVDAGLEDQLAEVLGRGQPALRADAHVKRLPARRGLRAHRARGNLDVLLAERAHHVAGRQLAGREAQRVQPDPHRVAPRAPELNTRNAGDASQRVPHEDVGVVGEEEVRVLALLREERQAADELVGALVDEDAGLLHLAGEPPLRLVHAVLDVDRREVLVAVHLEGGGDVRAAVVAAGRGEVAQPLYAVDLLLDGSGDGRLHRLGAGPQVVGVDLHRRRGEDREPADGQERNADGPHQHHEHGGDHGEDRPLDEEIDEQGDRTDQPLGAIAMGLPSWTFWMPETTTRSPASSPSSTG